MSFAEIKKRAYKLMAMPPERSRPLHNFTLPRLKWGNQRFLRCMKLNNPNPNPNPNPSRRSSDHDNNGIDEVREKLMLDLRLAADKMKLSILENKDKQLDNSNPNPNPERPWNLRTRRTSNSSENLTIINEDNTNTNTPKFSITLSREEIEADFLAMVGTKPPRRPKKRPKAVQRQLDTLLPGAWLAEITPESYKVPEYPESGKA